MKHRIVLFFFMMVLVFSGIVYLALGDQANKGGTPISSGADKTSSPSSDSSGETALQSSQAIEMKAVWVPFMSLDMSMGEKGRGVFERKVDEIIKNSTELGLNTLIVHVRPFGDAIYPSSYYPWSHILTGTQGMDPGYDPMQYLVEAAHKAGLELHAWINPLRVRTAQTPAELATNNPYSIWQNDNDPENDRWAVTLDTGIYYNPGYDGVRKHIIDGVREMVEKYDIDGVHMDDYFYPTQDASFDKEAYDAYCEEAKRFGEPVSLEEWRKQNINMLVSGIYSAIKSIRPSVIFGIAPQGNISNCKGMYADIQTWGSTEGYVDYLCPQIYFTFENQYQPYAAVAEEWRKLVTNSKVKLYAGLGLYKAGSSEYDNGQWAKYDDIIKKEIEFAQQNQYNGFMLYSYDYLKAAQTAKEVENAMIYFK